MTGARRAEPWLGTILIGDVRERLAELPPASIDCVITSPPYYGLRDYGAPGQLGLEDDVEGWVTALRAVMLLVARVLKPGGSVWLNLGDGYARHRREGAPTKSLLLGPERLALALASDGWTIRNKVIWAKTNPMPTSVVDRLSTTHEVIYLLTRSRRYFFDLDAIRAPHASSQAAAQARAAGRVYPPESAVATIRQTKRTQRNTGLSTLKVSGMAGHPLGKNPGDVWQLATAGYRGSHFASFPVSLIERPLLASTPERVCTACGTAWRRKSATRRGHLAALGDLYPGCSCHAGHGPGLVLDPFMGAGTVAVAAERHGRDWVGIELNEDYATLAEDRLRREREPRSGRLSGRSP
ncbi:site-specific DNA-methyltransferase [Frankia sp. Mgl5]|uniref:DNA-methyltransferase n=1 Tax=Frankia sp. Mgl5 TaxID=2933793 RepID=UPI002010798F|nr:site-specific DNA-methyltransferase [Frankia sp. Mgl5]MCK9928871.1 site-specific DNA-methyltransferase [Frankia sp. Mgl5]